MIAADQAIVSLYEESQLSVEEIADAQGYDITSVKACLMQNSPVYRAKVKAKKEDGFTDTEEDEAKNVIAEIMRNDELDAHVRLRAAIFVRNDKRGRLDQIAKKTDIKSVKVTVLQFNQQLGRANEARLRALGNSPSNTQEAIEVVTTASE